MTRRDSKILENLCGVSYDLSRRITVCEKRGSGSARVGYDDLIHWFDCVSDATELINRRLGERDGR